MTLQILELAYPGPSEVESTPKASKVVLSLDATRPKIGLHGRVEKPELFRDAVLLLNDLRESDLRYKGKDRTAYLAHLMKQGKKATAAIWEAQKAYLESAYADGTPRPRGLDPVFTVDPDEASIEVFSRDESAYARLALSSELFADRGAAHGTTLADLSPELIEQLERVRTYQPLELTARGEAQKKEAHPKKEIELPDEWLRGFLQVQSAATLPGVTAHLAPIDLYNILFVLRTHKAKKAPRGLRFELVPNQHPIVVIEPWEIALECHASTFTGSAPRIMRLFGRQRLLSLARALPHLEGVRVHLKGPGLPSFWVLDMGLARLTVALTSWSESKWASATSFDALMPREDKDDSVDVVVGELMKRGPLPLAELTKGRTSEQTRQSLQRACLEGRALFDVDRGVYRPRLLLSEPVDPSRIRYGSPREEAAHRLLVEDAATITKVHVIAGEGQEISGEVTDKTARRAFAPRFLVDIEGNVRDAWCNCPTYQRSAMREGPCEHMIALFVFERRERAEAERLRATPEGRKRVRAETRTLVRRDALGSQEEVRLSLDDRVVRIERRQRGADTKPDERFQRMWFDTDNEARAAYFARLDDLADKGFIDTDAMSA